MYLAFMWHAIIVPQSASLTRWAAIWWSTFSPQGSLSFLILGYPNLGKLPILIDFIKKKERKNWVYLMKNWNDMFDNWSISTRDLYLQKLWISKIHTFYRRKIPLLLNLTQFYTPGNNPNLKNEFIWKTPFSKNKDPCPTIGHKYQTGQKKRTADEKSE